MSKKDGKAAGLAAGLKRLANRFLVRALVGVRTSRPVVALTFDDGPDPDETPAMLDVLEKHGARGTFFMLGEAAVAHPNLVARVAGAGHAIGNHTWDHPSLPRLEEQERREQITSCAKAIEPHGTNLFRPPYGHLDARSLRDVRRSGHRVVAWSGHVEDWLAQEPSRLAARLISRVRPGAILLLHDVIWDVRDLPSARREWVREGLDEALSRLAGHYEFVTVPELLRRGAPRFKRWAKTGDEHWLSGARTKWAERYRPDVKERM
jgi:peptidoglycan-N-acetylglucosamine deacetylase